MLQTNRRALATDEWLRVEGYDNIYALGDCATVNQRRVMVCAIYSIVCVYQSNIIKHLQILNITFDLFPSD